MPQLRAEIASLPDAPALSPPQQRTRLYEAVWSFIAALARSRPLLLALDDVHSAGASTVALLEFVARRARRARVLVAVAWREREYASNYALADLRRRLDREGLASVVPFGALDAADVCELLRRLVDEDDNRATPSRASSPPCNGNALLVGETLRAWADAGVLDASARRWRDTATIPQLAASAGHASIVRERLERLTDDARTVAEIAAIAGDTFPAELVREASGIGERRTLDALDLLIDEHIVRDGVRGQYAFNHDVVRAAIVDEMTEPTRRRRQRRIAQVLERLYPERAADLAQTLAGHCDLGDGPGRCIGPLRARGGARRGGIREPGGADVRNARAGPRRRSDAPHRDAPALRGAVRPPRRARRPTLDGDPAGVGRAASGRCGDADRRAAPAHRDRARLRRPRCGMRRGMRAGRGVSRRATSEKRPSRPGGIGRGRGAGPLE